MAILFQHGIDPQEATLRSLAKEIVDKHLRPFARQDDKSAHFRREGYMALAEAGLTSVSSPKEFGGQGLPYRCYYAAIEEIARSSPSFAITTGVTNLIQGALIHFGTVEQKKRYLTKLTAGEWIGAFSLSEPGSGTDAAALKCQAKKVGNDYLINGTKAWCSSAGVADLYLLMARTDEHKHKGITAFLVEAGTPGFRVGKQERKMGLRSSPLAELIFEDCRLPASQMLANPGEGLKVALSQLDAGRISIGAVGAGIAQESLEIGVARGLDVNHLESLADHYATLQALKLLIGSASDRRDKKLSLTTIASMVKLMGSDLAVKSASDVIGLLGPNGVTEEFEIERCLRDAKALQIVEGTNQIQRSLLAKAMGEK